MRSMIFPNAKGGSLALAMIYERLRSQGGNVSPLAHIAPLGRDHQKPQATTADCGMGLELDVQNLSSPLAT